MLAAVVAGNMSDVPAPTNLMLERQLSTSFIIAWSPPSEISQEDILAYNVYSNGLFLTTVRSDDRTKALLEKLDPAKVACYVYAANFVHVYLRQFVQHLSAEGRNIG